MKDRKLKCWTAALAALVLAFAGACSDGSDGSESSVSSSVSGIAATYTDSDGQTATSTLLQAISEKMDSITANTFSMKSIEIGLGSGGGYKITAVATWTASNSGVDATYAIEGSYTASGGAITFGEPASIAVSDTARGDLSGTADYSNAENAINAIMSALTLTYSGGTLSADLDAVYEAIAGLVSATASNGQ